MKSLYIHYFGVCTLLFIIAFAAGCTEAVKTTPASPSTNTTPPVISTTLISVNPSFTQMVNTCPIPKLIFNNSQEITKLENAPGIRFTGRTFTDPTPPQAPRPGTIPLGGIIYHETGFTRIFDSNGKQILFVNDSESVAFIPAGYVVPLTYVVDALTVGVISPSQENNVSYVYQEGDDTCIAAIIRTPGSFEPPAIPPH